MNPHRRRETAQNVGSKGQGARAERFPCKRSRLKGARRWYGGSRNAGENPGFLMSHGGASPSRRGRREGSHSVGPGPRRVRDARCRGIRDR